MPSFSFSWFPLFYIFRFLFLSPSRWLMMMMMMMLDTHSPQHHHHDVLVFAAVDPLVILMVSWFYHHHVDEVHREERSTGFWLFFMISCVSVVSVLYQHDDHQSDCWVDWLNGCQEREGRGAVHLTAKLFETIDSLYFLRHDDDYHPPDFPSPPHDSLIVVSDGISSMQWTEQKESPGEFKSGNDMMTKSSSCCSMMKMMMIELKSPSSYSSSWLILIFLSSSDDDGVSCGPWGEVDWLVDHQQMLHHVVVSLWLSPPMLRKDEVGIRWTVSYLPLGNSSPVELVFWSLRLTTQPSSSGQPPLFFSFLMTKMQLMLNSSSLLLPEFSNDADVIWKEERIREIKRGKESILNIHHKMMSRLPSADDLSSDQINPFDFVPSSHSSVAAFSHDLLSPPLLHQQQPVSPFSVPFYFAKNYSCYSSTFFPVLFSPLIVLLEVSLPPFFSCWLLDVRSTVPGSERSVTLRRQFEEENHEGNSLLFSLETFFAPMYDDSDCYPLM